MLFTKTVLFAIKFLTETFRLLKAVFILNFAKTMLR